MADGMVFVKSKEVYAFSRNAFRAEKEEPLLVTKFTFVSLASKSLPTVDESAIA
jgi:hypothetical protein